MNEQEIALDSSIEKFNTYNSLLEDLKKENYHREALCSRDALEICKSNFRKIILAKKFSKIDDEMLDYELSNIKDCSGDFLSGILSFEITRLKFKEEITKCQISRRIQNYEKI